jgi:hypothetical protein
VPLGRCEVTPFFAADIELRVNVDVTRSPPPVISWSVIPLASSSFLTMESMKPFWPPYWLSVCLGFGNFGSRALYLSASDAEMSPAWAMPSRTYW